MKEAYEFLLSFPDRLYPHGRAAYEAAQAADYARYGDGHLGLALLLYREAFHLLGGVLVALVALGAARLLKSDAAFWALFAVTVACIAFQEFYFHPVHYGQPLYKGVADFLAWTLPLAVAAWYLAR